MLETTLIELTAFPERLHRIYQAVPSKYRNWAPESWEGVPSERFTALEQICHVRDIEVDGYQVRLRRMLETESPYLESIDSYEVAKQRRYAEQDAERVFPQIRAAREQSLQPRPATPFWAAVVAREDRRRGVAPSCGKCPD